MSRRSLPFADLPGGRAGGFEPYTRLGVGLVLGGGAFAAVAAAFAGSTALVALGISAVLLGVVALALARAVPEVPPEAAAVLLQTGLENLSALVEEIGLTSPALYMPPRFGGGKALALIPMSFNGSAPRLGRPLPDRLIVTYGPDPHNVGLVVRTAGTTVMQLVGERPGPSIAEMESAMAAALVGRLDVAGGVRAYRDGAKVVVELDDPSLPRSDLWIARSLGSPMASVVASMVAAGLDAPVRIEAEAWSPRRARITVVPLDEGVQ